MEEALRRHRLNLSIYSGLQLALDFLPNLQTKAQGLEISSLWGFASNTGGMNHDANLAIDHTGSWMPYFLSAKDKWD